MWGFHVKTFLKLFGAFNVQVDISQIGRGRVPQRFIRGRLLISDSKIRILEKPKTDLCDYGREI